MKFLYSLLITIFFTIATTRAMHDNGTLQRDCAHHQYPNNPHWNHETIIYTQIVGALITYVERENNHDNVHSFMGYRASRFEVNIVDYFSKEHAQQVWNELDEKYNDLWLK